ncbi:MAG TPA: GNAT family N-acetyltransferase [Steroidobacteraceae bacterium]|nr:GNAT family N-acetyltransferase [Steroidobacteraceae bacterium]
MDRSTTGSRQVAAWRGSMAESRDPAVRRVGEEFSAEALVILQEAATWAMDRGLDVWTIAELRAQDFVAAARAQQLVMGFSGVRPAAAMLIQTSDPIYWPEAAPNSSLFLHKIAVRREFAGQQWLRRLIEFAVADARDRGMGWIRLDTLFQSRLQGLYEALGFTVVQEPPLLIEKRLMIRMQRPSRTTGR